MTPALIEYYSVTAVIAFGSAVLKLETAGWIINDKDVPNAVLIRFMDGIEAARRKCRFSQGFTLNKRLEGP